MNVSTNQPKTFFAQPQLGIIDLNAQRYGYSPIEYRLSYINHTSSPVSIGMRSGFKFSIPSVPNMYSSDMVVRVELVIHHSAKGDVQRILSAVGEDASEELKLIRDSYALQIRDNFHGGATIILDYPMSLGTLESYGGSVYVHDLDCVISMESVEEMPEHPQSASGRMKRLTVVEEERGSGGFGYGIIIIDNSGLIGERFVNINNKVYRITPREDAEQRDGIYITANVPMKTGHEDPNKKEVAFYPPERECDAGLFRTLEDAITHGDGALARKQALMELEHNLAIGKKNLTIQQQQHEHEMLVKNKELEAIKMDRDARVREFEDLKLKSEAKLLEMSEKFNESSHIRKDTSEVIKILPAIAMGLGALFMMVKSVFS